MGLHPCACRDKWRGLVVIATRAVTMLTPEPSTSSRASDPLHDLQTSTYTPSRPPNLASVPPGLQISAAPCLYDIQTSRPPYLHAFQTSTASCTRAISTNTIKQEERRSPGTAMAGRIAGISRMVSEGYITGRKRRSMPGRR